MRPISNDLRIRIVQMRQAGHSAADISALLRVCVRSVQRYYKAFLDTGSVDARKKGKPEGSRLDPHKTLISDWIKKSPSITLEEMCARLEQEKQLLVHHTTLLRVLRRWGFRYKKNDIRKGTETRWCRQATCSMARAHEGVERASIGLHRWKRD